MRRVLQRLRNWFVCLFVCRSRSRAARVLEIAPVPAPDWMPEHQGAWNQFLNSPTGLILLARLKAVESQVMTNACKDFLHTGHSAGTANGWNECRLWLESLSRSSRVNEESEPDSRPTDMPWPGEASLHELLSP